jgi:uncharacterized protein YprB with RNaseH-like and TPR domain
MKVLKLTPLFLDIETTGLSPIEHEIVMIGIATLKDLDPGAIEVRYFSRDRMDEEDLIFKAIYELLSRDSNCLVGYNILNFDLPFLSARAHKHELGTSLPSRIRQLYRIDLMHVVTRYLLTSNRHIKLKDIAGFLNIPYDTEFSGSDIPKLYQERNLQAIMHHCRKDIETLHNLFFTLKDFCKHNLQRRYNLDCNIEFEGYEKKTIGTLREADA